LKNLIKRKLEQKQQVTSKKPEKELFEEPPVKVKKKKTVHHVLGANNGASHATSRDQTPNRNRR